MPPSLPSVRATEVLRALQKAGFFVHHQRGSHVQLKHPEKPGLRVTVPRHTGDVPRGTLRSILRQAELSPEEFRQLL